MRKKHRIIGEVFGVAMDLGARLATPVILCAYLVSYLSERHGLGAGWGLLIILFGVLSGIWNVYKLLRKLVAEIPKPRPIQRRRIR